MVLTGGGGAASRRTSTRVAAAASTSTVAPSVPGSPAPRKVRLLLVRHGQSEFNAGIRNPCNWLRPSFWRLGLDPGIRDPSLTAKGEAQSVRGREKLRKLLHSTSKTMRIYSSPMQRAVQTAVLMLGNEKKSSSSSAASRRSRRTASASAVSTAKVVPVVSEVDEDDEEDINQNQSDSDKDHAVAFAGERKSIVLHPDLRERCKHLSDMGTDVASLRARLRGLGGGEKFIFDFGHLRCSRGSGGRGGTTTSGAGSSEDQDQEQYDDAWWLPEKVRGKQDHSKSKGTMAEQDWSPCIWTCDVETSAEVATRIERIKRQLLQDAAAEPKTGARMTSSEHHQGKEVVDQELELDEGSRSSSSMNQDSQILVFGHSNFFRAFAGGSRKLSNGEILSCLLHEDDLRVTDIEYH